MALRPNIEPTLLDQAMVSWIAFRQSHDLEAMEMSCCEVSRQFFASMRALEEGYRGKSH